MFRKRPFGVTLLLWLVLSLTVWGAIRLLATLRAWHLLNEFEARLSPLYLSITGAGWILAGFALLWGLFSAKPWTRRAIPIAASLWLLQYWVERLFFQAPRANLFFALLVSIVLIFLAFINASSLKTKDYFTRSEDHEQPIEHSDTA